MLGKPKYEWLRQMQVCVSYTTESVKVVFASSGQEVHCIRGFVLVIGEVHWPFCHGHKTVIAALRIHSLTPHRKANVMFLLSAAFLSEMKRNVFSESTRRRPQIPHLLEPFPMQTFISQSSRG